MNPQLVTLLRGTVVLSRVVEPPPYIDKDNVEKKVEPYGELTCQTDVASLDDRLVPVSAYAAIRCNPDELREYPLGTVVELYVRSYPSVTKTSGGYVRTVVHRLAGPVPSAAATPRPYATSS